MDLQNTLNQEQLTKAPSRKCVFCGSVFLKKNFCEECERVQILEDSDSFWSIYDDYFPQGEFSLLRFKLSWGLFWKMESALEYIDRLKKRSKRLESFISKEKNQEKLDMYRYELELILETFQRQRLLPILRSSVGKPTTQTWSVVRIFVFSLFLLVMVYAFIQLFPL